jgi:hypothetical protein
MKPDRLHMFGCSRTRAPIHPIRRQSPEVCHPFERSDRYCTTIQKRKKGQIHAQIRMDLIVLKLWASTNLNNTNCTPLYQLFPWEAVTKSWNLRHSQFNDAISPSGRNQIMWAKIFCLFVFFSPTHLHKVSLLLFLFLFSFFSAGSSPTFKQDSGSY